MPLVSFDTPFGLQMFSGGIEREQWREMRYSGSQLKIAYLLHSVLKSFLTKMTEYSVIFFKDRQYEMNL